MAEGFDFDFSERQRSQAEKDFRLQLEAQSEGGPNVEPQTAAMFGGLLKYGGPNIQAFIAEEAVHSLLVRRVRPAAAASHFRTRVVHYGYSYALESSRGKRNFSDNELVTPELWRPTINSLERDLKEERSMAAETLQADSFLSASTTPPDRELGPETIFQLAADRFPHGIRRLDFGSSLGIGALRAVYKDEFPMTFEEVKIEPADDISPLIDVTQNANKILARTSLYTEVVCVDRVPFYREDLQRWDDGFSSFALSGLRPSERHSSHFEVIKSLMDRKRSGAKDYDPNCKVKFRRADLLEDEEFHDFLDEFIEPFDVITVNYVTQELAPEQQQRLHRVLARLLSENGILIYLHQAEIKPVYEQSPADITAVSHFDDYASESWRSNMHLQDNLNPVRGLQQAMRFFDNRTRRARLRTNAKLVVNGSLEPVSELIRNNA